MSRKIELDEKDLIILYELEQDCRKTLRELSEVVHVSKRMAEYRINRLMKKEAILNYTTVFDNSKFGLINHDVWFQLGNATTEKRDEFLKSLVNNKNVSWVASCAGKFDYGISIIASDAVTFSRIFDLILFEFSGIIQNYSINITTKFAAYPKTHLAPSQMKTRKAREMFSGPPNKTNLDATDLQILSFISINGKEPSVHIANKLDLAPSTVRKRMDRLEKEGVILGYRAVLNSHSLGFRTYEVLIKTGKISKKTQSEIEDYCLSNPNVVYLLNTIGTWSLDIGIDAKNSDEFQTFLNDLRAHFGEIIRDYDYVPVLKLHKVRYDPFIK